MERNVNAVKLESDVYGKRLIEFLDAQKNELKIEDAKLYHLFPLFRDQEDRAEAVRVLLISKNHGVLLFDCPETETPTLAEQIEKTTQVHSQVFSRLITSPILRKTPTELFFSLRSAFFGLNGASSAPIPESLHQGIRLLADEGDLNAFMRQSALDEPLDGSLIQEVQSVLEGAKAIQRKPVRRPSVGEAGQSGLGEILNQVESRIATFDIDQKRAALHTLKGPQRIRGLAGSGKTVVLTLKAALLHLQDPDATILYTYWTKNLHDFIRDMITRFFRQFALHDPNWDKVKVMHGWGGRNLSGVYYNACMESGLKPLTFMEAKSVNRKVPFDEACRQLLSHKIAPACDYCIIDEAQDFPASFYQVCYELTKGGNVIWGYDECQNILDIDIQNPTQTFGARADGSVRVNWSSLTKGDDNLRDVVLHRCYRNPRSILFYAFGLGLGLKNSSILQMPQDNDHWEDLGFKVHSGSSKESDAMVIERPNEFSPLLTSVQFREEDALQLRSFDNLEGECAFIGESIGNDLKAGLYPTDIMVICLDEWNTRKYFSRIEFELDNRGIKAFDIIAASSLSLEFSRPDHVTLTSVYRAKGNETGVVYVVGVDSIFRTPDSIVERNKLFTAFTRAKLRLTVTGFASEFERFNHEVEELRRDFPFFRFTMPNRSRMKNFQRGLEVRQSKLNQLSRTVENLAKELGLSVDEVLERLQPRTK